MRKQADHTPREMIGGVRNEKASRPYPAENIWWEKEREKKYNQRKGETIWLNHY